MPRIPPAELARLKREVSVEQLARARGVKLTRKGKDLHGLCPWHEEKTPSLVISPEKNLWNCFGCQSGGDVVAWVMKAEGVSFRHAVELLRADLPAFTGERGASSTRTSVRPATKLPKLADPDVEDVALLRRVVGFYQQTLKESPDAQEYLAARGLAHPELVERFQLGFANRTLGYRLPAKTTKEGRQTRERLQALGVLRKSGHEHLAGSLVVPLTGADGQVVQMYGRKTGKRLRKGTAHHLYLPGPQRGVFNREALAHSEDLILCESILDALTFWCADLRNVTCTYGAGGLHPDLEEALAASSVRRVFVAYDRDEAGDAGAEKVAKELTAMGIAAYRVLLPKGQDVNEYARKVTPAKKSLELVLRHAQWMGEGEAPPRPEGLDMSAPALEEERDELRQATEEGEAAEEEGGEEGAAPPDLPEAREDGPVSPPELPSSAAAAVASPEPSFSVAAAAVSLEPSLAAPSPAPSLLEHVGEDVVLKLGDRTYRARGLWRNSSPTAMKVNLRVQRESLDGVPLPPGSFHMETLDLYLHRPRVAFARQAATMLGHEVSVLERDLGTLLFALEGALDARRAAQDAPQTRAVTLSDAEREEALELLRSPDLLTRILEDFAACGVVGEEVNKLTGYLAASSRKLRRPLAVVVQSNSAAGKSSLMDAVLAFFPEEEISSYSAMTGQSLFYMADADLKHKVLAISEEEGAQRASYALKLLQSEGQLTIASTGKDPVTGRLTTEEYKVEGPVMIFLTTTATDVDEELMNRCLVLAVDEGQAQTEAIHRLQRERLLEAEGQDPRSVAAILRRQRNAQRLLEPIRVVNPYADQLTFPTHQTRFRRDHVKYLDLITTIALVHQHQRERRRAVFGKQELTYIEVSLADIAVANHLAHAVFGHSVDELSPQTRGFLGKLVEMVRARSKEQGVPPEEVRFRRRDAREFTGLKHSQVHVHLTRLEELEYVVTHAGRHGKSLVYELIYDGDIAGSAPHFSGLVDVATLHPLGREPLWKAEPAEEPAAAPEREGEPEGEREGEREAAPESEYDADLSEGCRGGFGRDSGGIRSVDPAPETPENRSGSPSLSSLLGKLSFPRKTRPGAKDLPDPVAFVDGSRQEIQ